MTENALYFNEEANKRVEMSILFYVSGHGFGHATRISALIEALAPKVPDERIHIRGQVPANIFEHIPGVVQSRAEIDVGVIEDGLYSQDIIATLRRYREIVSRRDRILEVETEFVKTHGVELIVSDIPPLASDIGRACRIPTIK